MKKFLVPARLLEAAKQLKDNMVILKGCSPEVKEVIVLARQQGLLTIQNYDKKASELSFSGTDKTQAYCLPDDCEIVAQDEKPQVPEWVAKRYVVCEVENYQSTQFIIRYPDGSKSDVLGLPAALRCDGWAFKGWLHEGIKDRIIAFTLVYISKRTGDWTTEICDISDNDVFISSTAYASVWQKAGE